MWDPAIHVAEIRRPALQGYHRRFCLKIKIGRGSPEFPSLMLALDAGGECQGLAFRVPAQLVDRETEILWMPEMISEGYAPVFAPAETPQGSIDALAFIMDRSCSGYVDLTGAEAATTIARGRSVLGMNLEYFDNMAEKVAVLGITDEVFEKIRSLLSQ
jgi:glutathione-specific gamma-glutamylcyclotransferase